MKIALFTFPFNNNYGGFLQAFALLTVLKRQGHDVVFINRRSTIPSGIRLYMHYLKFYLKKYVLHRVECMKPWERWEEAYVKCGVNVIPFVEKYIYPQSGIITSSRQLKKYVSNNKFEAIIFGSDQIWRPGMLPDYQEFFGSFVGNHSSCKLISYAASFGVDYNEYTASQCKKCGKLIERFSRISVREESGVNLIKNDLGWNVSNVECVLDPTLLLSAKDYTDVSVISPEISGKYVFCYILDVEDKKRNLIKRVCEVLNVTPYYIMPEFSPTNFEAPIEKRVLPPIEYFVNGINNSIGVMTDSFHGTAFSLIFQKPFVVFNNEKRGNTRITSILEKTENMFRMVDYTSAESILVELLTKQLVLGKQFAALKESSLKFILDSLKK